MKILHVIATIGPGGAEAFVSSLAVNMSQEKHLVAIFLLAGVQGKRGQYLLGELEEAGVLVFGKNPRSAWSFANVFLLVNLILKFKPAILHAHLFSAEVVCLLAAKLLFIKKNRLFRTLHSTDIIGTRSPFLIKIMDWFFGVSIACSDAVYTAYKRLYKRGYHTTLIAINNGVGAPKVRRTNSVFLSARGGIGVSSDTYMILNVGAFRGASLQDDAKAHDVAVAVFSDFVKIFPNAVLFFVGDGVLRHEVERTVAELGLEGKVVFTGVVADPTQYLLAADVFFFPSRREGLPISLLEAAIHGLPIVASDIPEIRNLDKGYPWVLSGVDDAAGYMNGLVNFYNRRGLEYPGYVDSVSNHFGVSRSAHLYISAYESV